LQDNDRKLAWAGVLVMAVIAAEIAWIIATGNSHHNGDGGAHASQVPADDNPWRWLISSAFWGAVFAGLLTVFNIGLWRQTRNLAKASRDQTKEMTASVTAAEKAANAATISADAAIGAARAWLLLTIDEDNLGEAILRKIEPESWTVPGDTERVRPFVTVHLDNRGKTPAFIREAAMELVISAGVPDRVIAKPLAPWWPEEIIIPADGRYPIGADDEGKPLRRWVSLHGIFDVDAAKLFEPDAREAGVPEFRFWLFGHVLYTDVWNNLHMTRFCLANDGWSGWFMPPEAMQYNERT
jgi:hypothetical protein